MAFKRPDFETIKRVYESVKADWSELGVQDEEMAKLPDMTYDVPFCDPGIENFTPHVIRLGWSKRGIKSWNGMFSQKPVWRHKPGLSTASRRQSERLEAMLNTLPWALEAAYGPFWGPGVEDCGVYGRGWIEVLAKRKRWLTDPDYPQKGKGIDPDSGQPVSPNESEAAYKGRRDKWKKDALPPISIRHLDGDGVKAILTEHYRVLQAVRYVTITLSEAGHRWPKFFTEPLADRDNDPLDEVGCYEYVDEEWCAQAVEYKQVAELVGNPYRHGMQMCPWVLMEGLTTASSDPNKRWEPYLKEAKDVGITMDSIATRQAMIREVWPLPQPHFRVKGPKPDGVEKSYELIELSPPKAVVTYDDTEFDIKNWGGWEPDTEYLYDKLTQAKDRALPDVGAQIAEGSSATPAWTWRLRGDMLERDMKTVVDNLALSAKRIGQALLRAMLSHWLKDEEFFYIGKESKEGLEPIKLSRSDIEGQINRIEATVKSSKLVDRNSNLGAAKMAMEMGLGKAWALEHLMDVENPQEVLDEALLEEVEYSEPMKKQLVIDVMERADLIERREAAVPAAKLAALAPFLPPGVQAAIQNVPMPGLGSSGVPTGAHPNTLTRTGVQTAQGGPTPFAEQPGGPTGV